MMGVWLLGPNCPPEHVAEYGAQAGGTTACKHCAANGSVTSLRNSTPSRDRADQARQAGDGDGGGTGPLGAYWAAQAPAAPWHLNLGPPSTDTLCKCGEPFRATGAGTALICTACMIWIRPASAAQRAEAYLSRVKARRSGQDGGGEIVSGPASRQARVNLRAMLSAALQQLEQLAEVIHPGQYELEQDRRAAFILHERLQAYRPELQSAGQKSEAAIAEVLNEISDSIINGEDESGDKVYQRLTMIAEQIRLEIHRDEQRQLYEERTQQRQLEIESAQAAQDRADAKAARAEQQQRQQQRQSAAPPGRTFGSASHLAARGASGYTGAALMLAEAAVKMRAQKEVKIARNGRICDFPHRMGKQPADRRYGAGHAPEWDGAVRPDMDAPSVDACSKHFADAEVWAAKQYPNGGAYHWELPL
jgi:hypothetical protein